MGRIGWGRSFVLAVAALSFAGLLDGRRAWAAEDEETPPAPPATETQANVLGTPETQDEDEAEDQGPNRGRISLSLVSDFTTAYFFRGILQERNGFIWQPAAEVGFNLWEGGEDSVFSSVDFGVGVWNSFHGTKTLSDGSGPSNLYETDIYPSLSVSFPNDIELSMVYYVYTSPNGAFDTVQNFDFGLAYDDSSLWGDSGFSVGPSVTVSFELDNTNFGDRRGSWLGLNAAPSVVAFADEEYPLTLAVPLAVGLSISEYYEVEGEGDETFGFFSFGFSGSLPLAFIPQDFGAWSVNAGVNVLVLGENLEEANLGLAARVAAHARGGQVLATAAVATRAGAAGIEARSIGRTSLRNLIDPVELFALDFPAGCADDVVDPVCRMRVCPESAPGLLRHGDRDYWFCSLACVGRFAANPDAYAAG